MSCFCRQKKAKKGNEKKSMILASKSNHSNAKPTTKPPGRPGHSNQLKGSKKAREREREKKKDKALPNNYDCCVRGSGGGEG